MERESKAETFSKKDSVLNKIKKTFGFKTSRILVLGFFAIILAGAILLKMDISLNEGMSLRTIDALFISTSAVCVTGLSTKIVVDTFSIFGQMVILALIQVGALGFMTFVCLVFKLLGKRLSLKNRMLFEESFDFGSLDITKLLKRIIIFVFSTEAAGALLLLFPFVRDYGIKGGVLNSIFISVSAFCNAGFDLFGSNSLAMYKTDWYVNIVIISLIILGGLGYLVVFDILRKIKNTYKEKRSFRHLFRKLNLHTKLVLTTTFVLIFAGTFIILLFESFNPETIGNLNFGDKFLISLFQTVTARTAGFNTIDMSLCSDPTNLLYMILMFIGGSPASTAGGIKTVTIAVLALTAGAMINSKSKTVVFDRTITAETIRKAIVVFFLGVSLVFASTFAFLALEDCTFLEGIFEVISAFGTVGSSLGITAGLSMLGKIILICLMFAGRVGTITILMSISAENNPYSSDIVEYPEEKIVMG